MGKWLHQEDIRLYEKDDNAFAGTTEGRKLCEYLTGKNCDTYVYVTTEYGRELLPQADNVHIHTGRMDEADMLKELEAKSHI